MLISALLLSALPQLPQRVYQPKLVDPGLHGGLPAAQNYSEGGQGFKGQRHNPGDITVDGRVAVLYRLAFDADHSVYRPALQVCVFDPDYLQGTGGYLDAYQHQLLGPTMEGTSAPGFANQTVPSGQQTELWGTAQSFTDLNGAYSLHFEPETDPGTQDCVASPGGPCPSIDPNNLPNLGRIRPLTVTLKPLPASHDAKGANPYPSDANGGYLEGGNYLTYHLWMVMPHYPMDSGVPEAIACDNSDPDTRWYCDDGIWKPYNPTGAPGLPSILGGRDLEVTIDLSTAPHSVERSILGDFAPLQTTGTSGPENIVGVEPSITADGQLLLYHGDAGNNLNTESEIDYVYNSTPCSLTGWTFPKSITEIYGETVESDFADRYALARQPIIEPDNDSATTGFIAEHVYGPGDEFNGAYPWVSRDGSFFIATHTHGGESPFGQATRTGLMVTGEITGGYVKHVDDRALNPTRAGRLIDWPQVGVDSSMQPIYDDNTDGQMTTFFSTGIKPGLWRPFPGEDVLVPTADADARVPVLPLWVNRTRMYGEVRFEEADGNYILYLACNEAFKRNTQNLEWPGEADPNRTPDSSGRSNRPKTYFEAGAGFGREAHPFPSPGPDDPDSDLADLIFARTGESHENIGFKGQGILFDTAGAIVINRLPVYSDGVTLQAFVKPMREWDAQVLNLITDSDRLELKLLANGKFRARVHSSLYVPPNLASLGWRTVTSNYVFTGGSNDALDPSEGWIHVAAVYDGDDDGKTTLKLYLDGQLDATATWNGTGEAKPAPLQPGTPREIYVGPRINGGGTDLADAVLVLDEVAISDVARTERELRRDAFVGPPPSDFEAVWHPGNDFPLPSSLPEAEVEWPKGLEYTESRTVLGQTLFADTILSTTDTVSCATCHKPSLDFTDGLTTAQGVSSSDFNTPTILNMAFGTHKLFDGRAASIEEQVLMPLVSGNEMGVQTVGDVITRMETGGEVIPNVTYAQAFSFVFDDNLSGAPGSITEERLADVLSLASLSALTGDSFFDDGDTAMSAQAEEGRALFFGKARCSGCHAGPNFSDDDFHNVRTVPTASSFEGRGGFTGREAELGQVRTPTLRDLIDTDPYFHDGSKTSLKAVVQHYNGGFQSAAAKGAIDRFLVPIDLTGAEEDALVAFLESLATKP